MSLLRVLVTLLLLVTVASADQFISGGNLTRRNSTNTTKVGNPTFNITDYGAKTNSLDNALAIQATIAQACAGGAIAGTIYFPPGTWVTNPVQITCSNLTFAGAGPASIVKLVGAATPIIVTGVGTAYGPFVPASGSPSPTVSNIVFQNFQIDGNKANQTVDNVSGEGTQSAIWLNLASSVTIRNMYIHDATSNCIYNNGGTSAIKNQLIVDNRIENCGTGTTTGGRGVVLGQSPQGVKVSRNHILGTLKQGIEIQNEGSQGIAAQDIDIGDNVLIGNNISVGSAGGIDVTDNVISTIPTTNVLTQRVRVHDNVLDGNSGIGIRLSENTVANASGAVGEMDDPVVQNNTVEGATVVGSASIQVLTTNGGLIKRPNIRGNKTNTGSGTATIGINIAGAGVSNAFIDGNHVFGVTAANTIVNTGTSTLVGCNMLDQSNPNMECSGANQTLMGGSGLLLDNGVLTANLNANNQKIANTNGLTPGGTAPSLAGFSVNGGLNPAAFGTLAGLVLGTTQTGQQTTGTITTGTASLAVASAVGWSATMGISVIGAGAATTAATPGTPTATLTNCSGTCTTSYQYKVVGIVDGGGRTAASLISAVMSNNATLNGVTNYNNMVWAADAAVRSYIIYRTINGGTTWTVAGMAARTVNSLYTGNATNQWWRDTGKSYTWSAVPATPQATPSSGNLSTTITAINGLTFTVAANAGTTVTSNGVFHDDVPVIKLATAAFTQPVSGGCIVLADNPNANNSYAWSSELTFGSVGGGQVNTCIVGSGRGHPVLQTTDALVGQPVVLFQNVFQGTARDYQVVGDTNGPPLNIHQSDVNNFSMPYASGTPAPARQDIRNLSSVCAPNNCFIDGIAFTAAPTFDFNNNDMSVNDVFIQATTDACILMGHYNNFQNYFKNIDCSSQLYGVKSTGGGGQFYGGVFNSTTNASTGGYSFFLGPGQSIKSEFVDVRIDNTANGGMIQVDPGAATGSGAAEPTEITFSDSDLNLNGSLTNQLSIDDESATKGITIVNSRVGVGANTGNQWTLNAPSTFVGDTMCTLTLVYNAQIAFTDNTKGGGSCFGTKTNSGAGSLVGVADGVIAAYDPSTANELGTIANAGTATCNFLHTQFCHFTFAVTSPAITVANPTNLPTKALVFIGATSSDTSVPTVSWGTNFYGWNGVTGAAAQLSSDATHNQLLLFTGSATPTAWLAFWSDGTTLYLIPGSGANASVRVLKVSSNVNIASGGALVMPDGRTSANTPEMTMTFGSGHDTSIVTNESLGTYLTVKPITIDNITEDIKESPTCTVSEVITCFDCGTAAGACTAGQTATISTTTTATGATRQSVAQTVTTASVAAAHYISCLRTAGACTVVDDAISFSYKMQ